MVGLLSLFQDPDDRTPSTSALDLLDLPLEMRKVMILLLRHGELSYVQLCEVIDQLPEAERISRGELDKALVSLTEQRWLFTLGEDQPLIYKVDMRRKGTNATGVLPKRTSNIEAVWDVLDLDSEPSETEPENQKPSIWDVLNLDDMPPKETTDGRWESLNFSNDSGNAAPDSSSASPASPDNK
jgi:hypothetical protein